MQIKTIYIKLIAMLVLAGCSIDHVTQQSKDTILECLKIEGNDTTRVYVKIFDSLNNIIMYKEGNLKINDSIVYTYNYKEDIVKECEYNNYGSDMLKLNSCWKYKISSLKSEAASPFYVDTFNLYESSSFKEVEKNYKKSLQIDTLLSDSGITIKCSYHVGEAIDILLPFLDNHRGAEYLITLDSMNLICFKRQIIKEEYFFEDREITRNYKYSTGRLVLKTSEVRWKNNNERDSYFEIYKYH